jgi:putative spermidine/putrescine transport system substrate-binding protein
VVRGGCGVFYDKILYAVYSDALQQNSTGAGFRAQLQRLIRSRSARKARVSSGAMPGRRGSFNSGCDMRSNALLAAVLLALALLAGCGGEPAPPEADLLAKPWEEIERLARGQTVTLMMWIGDPYINGYMNNYVVPTLKKRHGIDLDIVSGQGNQIVSLLMTEQEAGKGKSAIDLMWINGETFYQLRQIDALFGPFTEKLPNSRLIDFQNPFIRYDFQQEVDGYECPWGNGASGSRTCRSGALRRSARRSSRRLSRSRRRST